MSDLSNIGVGDKVVFSAGLSGDFLAVVEHATKTQLKVRGKTFRRDSGREVPKWNCSSIMLPTEAALKRVEKDAEMRFRQSAVGVLRNIPFSLLTTDQIKRMVEILEEKAS